MVRRWWNRTSVRLRTTVAATLVVAVALVLVAIGFVILYQDAIQDGLEGQADERANSIAAQIQAVGPPNPRAFADEDPNDPEDVIWQVFGPRGKVAAKSQPLTNPLPRDADETRPAGAEHDFTVDNEDATFNGLDYEVVVGVSLEPMDDAFRTLAKPLLVGFPLLLVLVAATTWMVATRALAPVERIRREADQITGDRLDRRVPEPASRDEIHRLARTMNRMLGRLQRSAERQQQFVADASHELRSPLASIRQTAEVARAHPGALPEGELADAVLEESARMQKLVEQLLLLTRAGDGAVSRAPQDVDLDDLALAEARRVARAGLHVDTSRVGAGRVRGDQTALAQVVRNLVDNAARHAHGSLAVAVHDDRDSVELVVEDDGPGIPAEHRERVFDRFVRLDEARARDEGGSGLGLSIVKEIVTAHGGTVTVSTSGLGGARFAVRLPAPAATGRPVLVPA